MVEDISLFTDLHKAAVIVSAVVRGFGGRLVGGDPDVVVADDDAAVGEIPVREAARCIAELMHDN